MTGVDSFLIFYVKFALVLIVILLGLAFHIRNEQLVVIDFYLANFEIPLSLALAISLLCGALLGVVAGLPKWLRLKHDKAGLTRELKRFQRGEQDKSADDAD